MSEQANNRQGGGGTESNRARAARGGVDHGGRPVDMLDREHERRIHETARGIACSGICTYAEARAHVEAMLAPRMEPLDAGQVREVFERVVGVTIGREHIAVPVDPNATAAQMAQAVARALGTPWEAEGNVVRQQAQPDPAPGQVWLPPPSRPTPTWTDADGTITIADLSGGFVRLVGGASVVPSDLGGWTCIGVATPHGRVMVGDGWRRAPDHEFTVTAIASEDGEPWIKVRYAGGQQDHDLDARNLWTCEGYQRTRYAPARAGERYRDRETGAVIVVVPSQGRINQGEYAIAEGEQPDPAQWERLDPGQGAERSTLGRELAFDYGGSIKGPPSVDYPYTLPDLANQARTLTLAPGSRLTPLGDGRTYRIEPEPERPSLTLQAPAPQLRALFDAIGRALELPATRHVCAFGEGLTVTVLRDEMLFTPTAQTGLGTAELAGDARALCALRACVATAMANGVAHLAQWGAKGPRVEVRREGGPMVAAVVAPEASEAPRYQPDAGGAGAWRWEAGES